MLAKGGDERARIAAGLMRFADPPGYTRACDEIAEALAVRWSPRPGETPAEHEARVAEEVNAWAALDVDPPIPIGLPHYP